jgi:DnaK suppressor protein
MADARSEASRRAAAAAVAQAASGRSGTGAGLHTVAGAQTGLQERARSSIRAAEKVHAGTHGAIAAAVAKGRGETRHATADAGLAGSGATVPGDNDKPVKGGAGVGNGSKARAQQAASPAKSRTVGSPIATIEVSSRSGGDKVKGVDTIKAGPKAGEAGASPASLPAGYRPSDDEPFMNERQRLYFRNKLNAWKEEIVRQNRETLQGLHEDSVQHADVADRATFETDRALELRARDRQRKLIAKIDAALARIEDGSYGYCEETGEPISLKRLDARPIATLSIEAQERHERRERVFREE